MSDNIPGDTAAAEEPGATAQASASGIKITVKTPKEKQTVEVSEDATVDELKEEVGKKFNNPCKPQLCLIFAGKILKDPDSLKSHGIKDGVTVHLVIKNPSASPAPAASSPAASTTPTRPPAEANASPFGSLGGLGGLGSMGMGGSDLAGVQQRMQSMVIDFHLKVPKF